jgi:hypothetical protein
MNNNISSWFTDKVLPGLFLFISISVLSSSFFIYQSVSELANTVKRHERDIDLLRIEIKSTVSQQQLMETMKRVEQQLEIMMLRSKLTTKIEVR